MNRAALYLRVSTKEQTVANQEPPLRRWAKELHLLVVRVYREQMTGRRSDRVALQAMLTAAHRREFDVILIWSLDRFTREGIGPTLGYLERLHTLGIRVLSLTERWLDTTGPMWELFAAVSAFWGKLELQRHVERTKAGMVRARAHGIHIGRPVRAVNVAEVRRRRRAGQSWRQIARALKVPGVTLRRRCEARRG